MENNDCGIMRRSQVFNERDWEVDKCRRLALESEMMSLWLGDRLKSSMKNEKKE